MTREEQNRLYSTSRARTILSIVLITYVFLVVVLYYETTIVNLGFTLFSGFGAIIMYGVIYYLLIWYQGKRRKADLLAVDGRDSLSREVV